jgi:uncharacterized protein (DUF58 family)
LEKIELQELSRYANFELLARQVVEGFITGLHRSPFHGFSVEFAEHRQYNTGESTRHIDWKLYARTEKLFIKRYEEETNLRCHLVVDGSSSMYFPVKGELDSPVRNKISFSALAAAALVELMKRQRDAFGLTIFSDKIDLHTPAKSNMMHQKLLFNSLEQLTDFNENKKLKKSATADMLHQVADMIHRRSLIVIFSDMFQNTLSADDGTEEANNRIFSALQHLKHNKHEVVLFHVVDKKYELDFDFENRPYRFIDLETNEELKLHPAEIKDAYTKALRSHEAGLRLKCAQYAIDFVEADINEGFHTVLWNFLVKRSKMY